MKTIFFYSLILVLGITFAGVSVNRVPAQTTTKKTVEKTVTTTTKDVQHAVKYTCPMHPEVVMNKAGKCPKCGMALVVKKETVKKEVKKEMNHMNHMKDSVKMKHTHKMEEMQMK